MGKRGNGEGSIYKQREGLYAAYITGADGKRKYFYGKTKTKVREKLNQALLEKQQGSLGNGSANVGTRSFIQALAKSGI